MGYTKKTIKGLSWMGGLRGSIRGLAFVRTAILARLLTPTQFGIFGIASLVLGFTEMLTETGINVVLIQEKDKNYTKYLNTAWVISIVRGFIISLLIFLPAQFISQFLKAPQSLQLIRLIAIVPIIKGFINPAIVSLQKHLNFKKEFNLRLTIYLTDALIAIALAYAYKNSHSLIFGLIAGAIAEVILSQLLIKPRPKLSFKFQQLKYIISKGKWITAIGIFNYLSIQGVEAVVAKIFTPAILGLYQLSYRISVMPLTEVSDVFNKVTFPVYTKISPNPRRVKKAFFKHSALVLGLSIPIVAALIAFPTQIVNLLLGPNWIQATPLLASLSIYGLLRVLVNLTAPVILAHHKQHLLTAFSFIKIVVISAIIIPLVNLSGILGAIHALIIASAVVLPLAWITTLKTIYAKS